MLAQEGRWLTAAELADAEPASPRRRPDAPPRGAGRPAAGRFRRTEHVESVAALVARVIEHRGLVEVVRHHRVLIEWTELVGPRVAAAAAPDSLSKGVLGVWVKSSAWLQELRFERDAIIARINEGIGGRPLVTELRFHFGGKDLLRVADRAAHLRELAAERARRHAAPPPRLEPTPAGAAALAQIHADTAAVEDDELRAAIERVRARWDR